MEAGQVESGASGLEDQHILPQTMPSNDGRHDTLPNHGEPKLRAFPGVPTSPRVPREGQPIKLAAVPLIFYRPRRTRRRNCCKDELIAVPGHKTFVEEIDLNIQISALRRALGDGQPAVATSSPFPDAVIISSPP